MPQQPAFVEHKDVQAENEHHHNTRKLYDMSLVPVHKDGCIAYVFSPPPTQIALYNGTTNDWTKYRSADYGKGIEDDGSTSLCGRPDIPQDTTSVCDRSTAEESSKKSGNENGLYVFGSSGTE
ncbi:MAG: hypothetical protein Q9195_005556 [Heterodermia aff. obscurata]